MKGLFGLFSRRDAAPDESEALAKSAELIRQGNTLEDQGKPEAACELYQRAIAVSPGDPSAHLNLGNAFSMLGSYDEALRCYHRAVELQPQLTKAHLNLGAILLRCQLPAEAETSYRNALRQEQNSASAWAGLGCALEMKADSAAAIPAFEKALVFDPGHDGAASRLAQLLRQQGEARTALQVLDAALSNNPSSAVLLRAQADINGGIGEYAAAISAYRRIIASGAADLSAFSNLLWTLNFVPEITPEEVLSEHRKFGDMIERLSPQPKPRVASTSTGRLRIGYVSPDFRRHSVSCFIEPLLRNHDRDAFEVHCLYDYPQSDDVTARIKQLSEHWHEIASLPDQEVAQLVLAKRIDILVDLTGHSAHNRMGLFALKPAPVQFTWLGYLCTTGLRAIDYRLCDFHTDPEGVAEGWQVEQPLRMPHSQWCYQPQVALAEPSPLPMRQNGFWTFGSFNQESKLNVATLVAWSRVLGAIPNSRLRIVGITCDVVEERIRHCLAANGVSPERIELLGRIPINSYFSSYDNVDIALDSFPYNGATTTCDALIMGVPVATVAGQRAIARGGVSLLTTIGLSDWIVRSPDELAAMLKAQTSNPERMTALRSQLPGRMRGSALMDGSRFARNLEEIYRWAWQRAT